MPKPPSRLKEILYESLRLAAVIRMFRTRCQESVYHSAISLFQRFFIEKAGKRAGWAGRAKLLAKADFVGRAACLNSRLESKSHARWIVGNGNGGIHKHSVGSHFHCLGGVAGGADAGIDNHPHGGLHDEA